MSDLQIHERVNVSLNFDVMCSICCSHLECSSYSNTSLSGNRKNIIAVIPCNNCITNMYEKSKNKQNNGE